MELSEFMQNVVPKNQDNKMAFRTDPGCHFSFQEGLRAQNVRRSTFWKSKMYADHHFGMQKC